MAKRTAQAVDGDQLLSPGTSGISSLLCPLFLRQISLPGPGRGLFTEPASSFTPAEEPESAGIVFSADHRELTACIMSKAAAGEEFPLLLCSRFSAAAACGRACDFLDEAIIWHLVPTPLQPRAPLLRSAATGRDPVSPSPPTCPSLVPGWSITAQVLTDLPLVSTHREK